MLLYHFVPSCWGLQIIERRRVKVATLDALCVIAVAVLGLMMLTGRLPVRGGLEVVLGCFVLLGAPVIAGAFIGGVQDEVTPLPSRL